MSTVRIQLRRGLADDWYEINPQLGDGEVGFESDTRKFKFGNGQDLWNDLQYAVANSVGSYIPDSEKGNPDGVATLDSDGLIPAEQLPLIAKISVSTVLDQTARLALTAQPGDIAIQSDTGTTYVLSAAPASTNSNWKEIVSTSAITAAADAAELAANGYTDSVISTESQDRNTAISNAISTEVTNRNNAISTAIGDEVTDRDLAITSAINDEIVDRDAAITSAINQEGISRNNAISDAIDTEVSNRNSAISAAISTEVQDRNTEISNSISTEVTNRNNAISDAIDAEVLDRDAAIAVALSSAESYADSIGNTVAGDATSYTDSIAASTLNAANIYADAAAAAIVDSAPSTLNTLNELAAALNDDASFSTTIATSIGEKVSKSGDSLTGSLNFQDLGKVTGLTAPSFGTDAATKDYVDDSISTEVSDRNSAITSAIGQEVTDRNLAISNAVSDEATDRDTAIATALDSANDYTDAEIITAISTAESYTDGLISTEVNDRNGAIATAKSEAINTSQGYTDSAISSEVISRDAAIAVALGSAEDYADGIQTTLQGNIDLKAPLASPTFTGEVTVPDLIATGNVTVEGDFTVNGTNFAASATSITIEDNMLQLAHQNAANTVDLGIVVGYNDGTAKHAGLVKDVSDAKWKLFKDVTTEPSTVVDFTQGSLDDLAVAGFTASSATIGNVSDTELQYLNGVTSAVQDQLDDKAPLASPTFTGTADFTGATVTGIDLLPSQGGNGGKYLKTDGSTTSWETIAGSFTLGSTSVSVGGTTTTVAGLTLTSPTISTITNTGTITIPSSTDTLVGRATSDILTNKSISGSSNTLSDIANSSLTNSKVTVGSTEVSLGSTVTSLAGLTSVTSTGFTGDLTGNASTATKFAAPKTINGENFDGTADITIAAAAGTLTGNTLASGVTASSLTSVGTLTTLTTSGNVIVGGDLTVNGTTTTINSTIVNVDDILIELGTVSTPTDTTANGGGIALKGDSDKTILWNSSDGNWTSNQDWNLSGGKAFKINNNVVLSSTQVLGKTIGGTSSGDIADISTAQTFTNKTLTSPTINAGALSGTFTGDHTISGVATFSSAPVISSITNTGTLTLPTSSDTLVGRATIDTLTNKTLTLPVIGSTGAKFNGSTSGTITVLATATAGTNTLTIPAVTGNIVTTGDTSTVTSDMIDGTVYDAMWYFGMVL